MCIAVLTMLKASHILDSSVSKIWYVHLLQKCRTRRRYSMHDIFKSRRECGEFYSLYEKLRQHPEKFYQYTRMTITTFDYILDMIRDRLTENWTNFNLTPIGPAERLIITLRFLATGTSFKSLSFNFRVGCSTVAKIIKKTVTVLWEILQPIHLRIPNQASFQNIAKEYYEKWNFPNCIGSIDGKHIRVKCPKHTGTMFYNYKHYFSIVLQGVVDANYKFVMIDVGGFGKQSDGGTFRSSAMFQLMQHGRLNIPDDKPLPNTQIKMPLVFVGDEAYPLMRHLLKPYSRQQLDPEKEYFNMRLSRARRLVECAFGILNAKWRLLWKPIETHPEFADLIVKCMCVLHNTILDLEGIDVQMINEIQEQTNRSVVEPHRENNRPTNNAIDIRDTFKHHLCNNRI